MIFGMALYNHCTVMSAFPQALFKKLLGLKPTLEDLRELLPIQARYLGDFICAKMCHSEEWHTLFIKSTVRRYLSKHKGQIHNLKLCLKSAKGNLPKRHDLGLQ